ncbi:MAG: PhnD/SsuA/transferrin family substrate-binding protein [Burkholderiales bacterium]|nr:PhnD/SsuA/transferrin family substrate-binding protein [Burkholderiales bacterium]
MFSLVMDAVKTLNFGIISTVSSQNLKQDWQPVLDEMSKKLGIKINAFFATDYASVIEGMRFTKVQFAWVGNKSAIEASDRANSEVFAQTVNADGTLGKPVTALPDRTYAKPPQIRCSSCISKVLSSSLRCSRGFGQHVARRCNELPLQGRFPEAIALLGRLCVSPA